MLADHFERIERTQLDYALTFPSGVDLASSPLAVPSRRHLADRVRGVEGPLRLSYGLALFAATRPRR